MTPKREKWLRTLMLLLAAMLAVSLTALGGRFLLRGEGGNASATADPGIRAEGVCAAPAKGAKTDFFPRKGREPTIRFALGLFSMFETAAREQCTDR